MASRGESAPSRPGQVDGGGCEVDERQRGEDRTRVPGVGQDEGREGRGSDERRVVEDVVQRERAAAEGVVRVPLDDRVDRDLRALGGQGERGRTGEYGPTGDRRREQELARRGQHEAVHDPDVRSRAWAEHRGQHDGEGEPDGGGGEHRPEPVSYTHLRAHETVLDLVCRLLLEKKKKKT